VAYVAWTFIASGERFLHAFVRMLDDSKIERGIFSVLSGRSYAVGRFRGKDVAMRAWRARRAGTRRGWPAGALHARCPGVGDQRR
jgi:hypothetical protein